MVVLFVISVTWQTYVVWRGLQMVGKGRCRRVRKKWFRNQTNRQTWQIVKWPLLITSFRYWWHQRLSLWQVLVPAVTTKLAFCPLSFFGCHNVHVKWSWYCDEPNEGAIIIWLRHLCNYLFWTSSSIFAFRRFSNSRWCCTGKFQALQQIVPEAFVAVD